MNEPRKGLGLRPKLILFVVIGIVVASTAIGLVRVWQEKQKVTAFIEESGRERVLMLSVAVANLIIAYDYGNMESIADKLMVESDVLWVVIRNAEGKTLTERAKRAEQGMTFTAPVRFGTESIGDVELAVSLRRLNESLAKTYKSILLEQLVFGIVLGLLVYIAISRAVVSPLKRVTEVMGGIISSPNPSTANVLKIESNDEIGHLAAVFNSMNQTIMEYQGRLHQKIDLANSALIQTNDELRLRSVELEKRTQALEKALEMVEKLATTDSLTSLANRRSFDDVFEQQFVQAIRHKEPLTLVLFDVDKFKRINDTHGHGAGDATLKEIGSILNSRIRKADFTARLGGDEFAIIMHRGDKEAAKRFVEDFMGGIIAHDFVYRGALINVTLSFGIAELSDELTTPELLYVAADKALYVAKDRGRDQYAVYSEVTTNQEET
jgi:diguanylate cyclase (GGDEF)-like protein